MSSLFENNSHVKAIWKVYVCNEDVDTTHEFLFDSKEDAVELYYYLNKSRHFSGEINLEEVYVYTKPKFAFGINITLL